MTAPGCGKKCYDCPGGSAPVAAFTVSSASVQEAQSVSFTDQSTGGPTSWQWTFAGGTPSVSASQDPTVTYSTAGIYDVSLTATNANGSDTRTQEGYITVTADGIYTPGSGVTDIDGNSYSTIILGTQEWMQQNLKTAHYRNGDPIPTGLSNSQWGSTATGAYAVYAGDNSNDATYGKLYNWYAVDDSRGLCPLGWHMPSDDEWKTLEIYIGMSQAEADQAGWRGTDEGGKLKETGYLHWASPNTGAANSSGFTGLPGGYRDGNGGFHYVGSDGNFWSASSQSAATAWGRFLDYSSSEAGRSYYNEEYGLSCRCLRD